MVSTVIRRFLATQAAGGLLLVLAAALAMLAVNSPLQEYYNTIFSGAVRFWVNDGLMTLFFLLVGLEIKRELVHGELSTPSKALLPVIAAVGGMALPAVIYTYLNWHSAAALHGWAIGSATDIAFSLCVLALCGSNIPASLKIFLTAVAVIDDLGAVVIIALFYTGHLSVVWMLVAAALTFLLFMLGRENVASMPAYIVLGAGLWFAVLHSGIHPTIAGVVLAMLMPLKIVYKSGDSLLLRLEHWLHPWVSYVILPLFAFSNGGINLADISLAHLEKPVTLGVMAGLFFGKQIGIFLFTALSVALGFAGKPEGASWAQIYGVAILAGIGFTMSLFISHLAFGATDHFTDAKLGVMAGSLLSALVGYVLLRSASR